MSGQCEPTISNEQQTRNNVTDDSAFDEINDAKTCMNHIYDQADPRAYFCELKNVGYVIPDAAKPIFQNLISRLQNKTNDTVRVLDIGCSYGVNAALLKHDLSIGDLYERWGDETLADATPEDVVKSDKRFFAELDTAEDIEVIGLDSAENAVAFAEHAGLLDEGLTVDLENGPLPEAAKEDLAPVSLVTSTGCVGYVTEKSFNRLLPAVTRGRPPWFANFVLRMFPFDAIETTLEKSGYVTEKLGDQTFIQRAFASTEEQGQVVEQLREQGIDPTGKETEGHLLAEFYLSRPLDEAIKTPVEVLVLA